MAEKKIQARHTRGFNANLSDGQIIFTIQIVDGEDVHFAFPPHTTAEVVSRIIAAHSDAAEKGLAPRMAIKVSDISLLSDGDEMTIVMKPSERLHIPYVVPFDLAKKLSQGLAKLLANLPGQSGTRH